MRSGLYVIRQYGMRIAGNWMLIGLGGGRMYIIDYRTYSMKEKLDRLICISYNMANSH